MSGFTEVVRRLMDEQGTGTRSLARQTGHDPGYVSRVINGRKPPGPDIARRIDEALGGSGEVIAAAAASESGAAPGQAAEARDVMDWLSATNIADATIEELGRAASYLAEAHTRLPAPKVLAEVAAVHQAVKARVRSGRQRLSQARELVRIDSELLAHAALLEGDLGRYAPARDYGSAALMCAQEAGTDEGVAWTVMAKTARWQGQFAEAAGLAARGSGASVRPGTRAELAYREANAVALFGDAPRARAALGRADGIAGGLDDSGPSAWSFPKARQAVFALSVCVRTGDPDGALRAAADADAYWAAGGPRVTATWAQVRAGAAMAHLLKDSLDGAAEELLPVLRLPGELRIRTVTGYLSEVAAMLAASRFAGSGTGTELRSQITEFCTSGAGAG